MNLNPSNLGSNFSLSDAVCELCPPPLFTPAQEKPWPWAEGDGEEDEEVRAMVDAANMEATRVPDPFILKASARRRDARSELRN